MNENEQLVDVLMAIIAENKTASAWVGIVLGLYLIGRIDDVIKPLTTHVEKSLEDDEERFYQQIILDQLRQRESLEEQLVFFREELAALRAQLESVQEGRSNE